MLWVYSVVPVLNLKTIFSTSSSSGSKETRLKEQTNKWFCALIKADFYEGAYWNYRYTGVWHLFLSVLWGGLGLTTKLNSNIKPNLV